MSAPAATGWLEALARRRRVWVLVLAVALAARLTFVLTAPPTIAWVDGRNYEQAGWRIASQGRFTGGTLMAPGYPAFIGGVYSVFGHRLRALRLTEAVISTATVGLIGAIGVALFSPGPGLIAAILAAAHPILTILPSTQYSETLVLFLSTLGFGVLALALKRPGVGLFAAGGVFVGLAMLCKPTVGAVLPGIALATAVRLRARGYHRLAWWAAAFVLALSCVVGTWWVRNHAVYGRWFFTTKSGQQLWMGSNPAYRGETTWVPDPKGALLDSLRAQPDEFGVERVLNREAIRFIREQPGRAAWLYLLKVRNVLALYPITQTRTGYTAQLANWAQAVSSLLIYVGVVLGLARAVALGFAALPLGILSYVLLTSVYLTVMRYRMGVEMLFLWLAGLGWWYWLEGRRSGGPLAPRGQRLGRDEVAPAGTGRPPRP